jgi:hypothetical protein
MLLLWPFMSLCLVSLCTFSYHSFTCQFLIDCSYIIMYIIHYHVYYCHTSTTCLCDYPCSYRLHHVFISISVSLVLLICWYWPPYTRARSFPSWFRVFPWLRARGYAVGFVNLLPAKFHFTANEELLWQTMVEFGKVVESEELAAPKAKLSACSLLFPVLVKKAKLSTYSLLFPVLVKKAKLSTYSLLFPVLVKKAKLRLHDL